MTLNILKEIDPCVPFTKNIMITLITIKPKETSHLKGESHRDFKNPSVDCHLGLTAGNIFK